MAAGVWDAVSVPVSCSVDLRARIFSIPRYGSRSLIEGLGDWLLVVALDSILAHEFDSSEQEQPKLFTCPMDFPTNLFDEPSAQTKQKLVET